MLGSGGLGMFWELAGSWGHHEGWGRWPARWSFSLIVGSLSRDWIRYEGGGTWSPLMTGAGRDSVRGREVKTAEVLLGSYTVYVVSL